ncbi:phage integrase N-terminal SAM-like domain-containing protein [Oceanisphaera pacifica]|uniref:Phage integrase N-terminal SAM-like domain-containing protein n=1 Tax=Oceanisphaera pacifica TaxID=2818389 RepID=A0ABS3NKE6_9GAMM|nr:phage integrase N-terminal SAM-like domain-containing protein [Oceanisphaera pacifica]MBO1520772.1 phage integrase N-terminal SAM-like domain-containing protein [Oceanisphaera pacifica]
MMLDVPPKLPDKPTRFMDQLRALIRSRNLAYKTEQTYCHWVKRFIRFHNIRHPSTCSTKEVEQFLSHLAVQRNSSVSTQRTALNAIVFLFREFLQQPLDELSFELARKPRRLPTVFTHNEAKAVISHLEGTSQLVARLMYGSGLRINEVLRLRVKDIDFGMQQIIVRSGKGNKDRTTLLSDSLLKPLSLQIDACLHPMHGCNRPMFTCNLKFMTASPFLNRIRQKLRFAGYRLRTEKPIGTGASRSLKSNHPVLKQPQY